MENSGKSYRIYAEEYVERMFGPIKKESDKKKVVLNKLSLLFQKRDVISDYLRSTAPFMKTPIKVNVSDSEQEEKLDEYIMGGACERDMKDFCSRWEDNMSQVLEDGKRKTVNTFVKENDHILAPEIAESFLIMGTKILKEVPHECLAGVCYGMILLEQKIEHEIWDVVSQNSITKEDVDRILELCSDKINWVGDVQMLAKLFNTLIKKDLVNIKYLSAKEKANLIYPHFLIKGKAKGTFATPRSLQDAFDRTKFIIDQDIKALDTILKY
jgi:hypothetical protein